MEQNAKLTFLLHSFLVLQLLLLLLFILFYSVKKLFYINADSLYVKLVGHNLSVSHRHHICNCCLTNSSSYLMYSCAYDLSPFLHTKFHTVIVTMKPKARENIYTASILLFYITQKYYCTKDSIFFLRSVTIGHFRI